MKNATTDEIHRLYQNWIKLLNAQLMIILKASGASTGTEALPD